MRVSERHFFYYISIFIYLFHFYSWEVTLQNPGIPESGIPANFPGDSSLELRGLMYPSPVPPQSPADLLMVHIIPPQWKEEREKERERELEGARDRDRPYLHISFAVEVADPPPPSIPHYVRKC